MSPESHARRARRARPGSALDAKPRELAKAPSGIRGLDEITAGGLPRGRPTLVCGGPGCGKTLFAMEFLIRGATEFGEPGVFMAFEETPEELADNVASLGFDVRRLEREKRVAIDFVRVERGEIEETGEYDLEGLFVRLQLAIDSVGAKRVVLDTIEALFSGLPNPAIVRSELRRLFRWLKDRGQTVVLTGEKGEGVLTRHGLEEYVSDCVIFLDHRVDQQNSTRRLRIVKYRGTLHGTNEYPFLIDERGISILPITSIGLTHRVSAKRISTGVPRLDEMLGGRGIYRGSSVLVSGTAGTGKTSLAAIFARTTCERGGRCLYLAYEESPDQIVRNMRSIGIDLAPFLQRGTLRIVASRPTAHGLEMHLVSMHKEVVGFEPEVVVLDPITNLVTVGTANETRAMMVRLIDFLKGRGITTFFTSLTSGGDAVEESDVGISSLIDTWLLLSVVRSGGERNRTLSVIKSRGMPHSNQSAEYRLTAKGLELLDTYVGSAGVTGSSRLAQEAADAEARSRAADEHTRRIEEHARRRRVLELQIEGLREELAAGDAEARRDASDQRRSDERLTSEGKRMAVSRKAFTTSVDGRERR